MQIDPASASAAPSPSPAASLVGSDTRTPSSVRAFRPSSAPVQRPRELILSLSLRRRKASLSAGSSRPRLREQPLQRPPQPSPPRPLLPTAPLSQPIQRDPTSTRPSQSCLDLPRALRRRPPRHRRAAPSTPAGPGRRRRALRPTRTPSPRCRRRLLGLLQVRPLVLPSSRARKPDSNLFSRSQISTCRRARRRSQTPTRSPPSLPTWCVHSLSSQPSRSSKGTLTPLLLHLPLAFAVRLRRFDDFSAVRRRAHCVAARLGRHHLGQDRRRVHRVRARFLPFLLLSRSRTRSPFPMFSLSPARSLHACTDSFLPRCCRCPTPTAIDLSQSAFLALAPGGSDDIAAALDAGVLSVQWWFTDSKVQQSLGFGFREWAAGASEA